MGRTFLGCPLVFHAGTRPPPPFSPHPGLARWFQRRETTKPFWFSESVRRTTRTFLAAFLSSFYAVFLPGAGFLSGYRVSSVLADVSLRVPTGLAPRNNSRAFVLGCASLLTCGVSPKSPDSRGASPIPEPPPPKEKRTQQDPP
ncbi:hypothetical protein LZ31DRAFT_76505 [Colletotrichum somersetense]|nr:hypothetical protein LZ31DRAFT_76505 [Colletotrichum somersetense]